MSLPAGRQSAGPPPLAPPAALFRRGPFLWSAAAILASAGTYLLVPPVRLEIDRLIFVLSMADIHAMRGWLAQAGAWAPAVSLLVMVFQAVLAPLPAVIVTFANAALFGWAFGAFLSWTGAMLGAVLCYAIAMGLGRTLVERHAPRRLVDWLDRTSGRYGAWAVFFARLMPFISFDAVSYAAGLLRLRLLPFLVATGLGQLPATIVYSLAGDFLSVNRGLLLGGILFMLAAGAIVLPLRALYSRRNRE
jgi:uncharacterized membrane protein YdjX (TVP38/TMEM64 family)